MQHNKSITNFSEIGVFAKDSETLSSTLSEVIGKFKLKSHLATFDALKSKGLAISSIVSVLTLLPFYGVSSVYAFIKNGIKASDIRGKKDVYYDVKNNEFIDWRTLLLLHAKRFRYLMLQNQNTCRQACSFGYKVTYLGMLRFLEMITQSRIDGTFVKQINKFEKTDILIL
ncbi:MAG: hypothetical protein Q8R96_18340, partial [Bacteroidota bacterium]|nr:hypothetical protein [Bacteroidota bacterium]